MSHTHEGFRYGMKVTQLWDCSCARYVVAALESGMKRLKSPAIRPEGKMHG